MIIVLVFWWVAYAWQIECEKEAFAWASSCELMFELMSLAVTVSMRLGDKQ